MLQATTVQSNHFKYELRGWAQAELGGDVAGVLLEGVDLDGSLDRDALEFHLQDLSAAAITHLVT